ncbi:MAG: type II CAAX endopeptidase family protein [Candidatus Kapabacteria bacterium]|nr:type II CAAX endopeptidase family protein [Candidatus Kapabacteria bacterium]
MLKTSVSQNRIELAVLGIFILSLIMIFFFAVFITDSLNVYNLDILLPLIIITILLQKLRYRREWWELGLNIDATVRKNSLMSAGFVFLSVLIILVMYQLFTSGLNISHKYSGYDLSGILDYSTIILLMLISVIIEELIFRGLAFQIIDDKFGKSAAIIITSTLFAAGHFWNPSLSVIGFMNIYLGGVLLALMYIKSRSLYPQIIFHFGWNLSLAFIISSPVSGQNFGEGIFVSSNQNLSGFMYILLGGGFGLEEGLLTTVILLMLIVFTAKYFEESPAVMALRFQRKYTDFNRLC